MHEVSPATQQVTALREGVSSLDSIYSQIDSFATKGQDPPNWTALLRDFRSALGQIKAVQENWATGGDCRS